MGLGEGDELGGIIGGLIGGQGDTNQMLSGDEGGAQDTMFASFMTTLDTTVSVFARDLSGSAFIVDHVVYGEVDSSVLEIDGYGYVNGARLLYTESF